MKIKGKQIDSLRVQKLFTETYVPGDNDDLTTVEYVKNYVSSQMAGGSGAASGETVVENALNFTLDSEFYSESAEVTLKGARTFTEVLLSSKLSAVTFKIKLDSDTTFTDITDINTLNNWVTANVSGDSTIYQLRVVGSYAANSSGRASITLQYSRSVVNGLGGTDQVFDLSYYFNFDSDLDTTSREIIFQGFRDFSDFYFSKPIDSATFLAKLDVETDFTEFATLQDLENWQALYITDDTTLWQLKVSVSYKSGQFDESSATLLEQVILSAPRVKAVTGTGWAEYEDTQYNTVSPFRVASGSDVVVPNNAAEFTDVELPGLVSTFYDEINQRITANKIGDGMGVRVSFKAKPTQSNTIMDLSLDVGGTSGKIYRHREMLFSAGVEQPVNLSISPIYAMDDFFNNGGQVKINTDQDVDIYDIVFVISRYHESTSG